MILNVVCEVCGAIGYEHLLLCCHDCKGAHTHQYCLQKVLFNAPKEGWFCDECHHKSSLGKVSNERPSNHAQFDSISQQPISTGINLAAPAPLQSPATGITQCVASKRRKALAPIRCQDFHSLCSLEAETGALAVCLPSHVQSKVITHNEPAPEHDTATFVSPSLAQLTDTVVAAPEQAVAGETSPTRTIVQYERTQLCNLNEEKVNELLRLAYEKGLSEPDACLKAEVTRLTEELEDIRKVEADAFMRMESIEEALQADHEQFQRRKIELLKEKEALTLAFAQKCNDLDSVKKKNMLLVTQREKKQVEELNQKHEQLIQTIDQVTRSSEEETRAQENHFAQLNEEMEDAKGTLEQVKKSYEGEKKAREDQVNQLNQRIEETYQAFELEKRMFEKATQKRDLLKDELKTRNEVKERLMLAITQLKSIARQMRADEVDMEEDTPSVQSIWGQIEAQVRALNSRMLTIGNDLMNWARDQELSIRCSVRDLLVKLCVRYPKVDLQSLLLELVPGDYTELSDEVQPIAIELSKKAQLSPVVHCHSARKVTDISNVDIDIM